MIQRLFEPQNIQCPKFKTTVPEVTSSPVFAEPNNTTAQSPPDPQQPETASLQSVPPTQPAEASASSQITSSISKPPNWDSMTGNQKKKWLGRHYE